ncbi:calcium-binding and coiled-coil domain-containing 1 [Pelobates cultripes]|uniref:Calcium-binding and coiled-coil domain-containing 1 n=1 Tax=Pelobates cultripes TaxID=61616 RepID=A0AAD1VRC8_PELCU|nr:calcium-binding and coiled-coil domain-containing 1 [Pelobates cultripes]CAH2224711.1 calcium-binding and coiled-coil domain-containing 1 [Pelobates cultripes]CAH2224712.1 calcium-binding and coiled-coil domain-containing 1 [Pelobates cultripes]
MEITNQSLQQEPSVNFLNVAHSYVPNTKVECHYTLPLGMKTSTSDWIGIFKVGAASIRDYDTFVWTSSPETSGERNSLQCSVQFQAYYLPRPGQQQYHFRYVDRYGIVRGCSDPFVFGDPGPLEDLVTLEDEETSMDMLLVVPKATLLQRQLEESQQERNALMRVRLELEEEVNTLQKKIDNLEAALKAADEKSNLLSQKLMYASLKDELVKKEYEILSSRENEHCDRIEQLLNDIEDMKKIVLDKDKEIHNLKVQKCSIEEENGKLKLHLGDATSEKEHCQLQVGTLQEKLRSTMDVLSSNQQKVMLLSEELATASSIRDRTISDLHKSRLETADLAIKVSDLSLRYKEGLGQWWQEKTTLNHSLEAKRDQIVNLKAEKQSLEGSLQDERYKRQALESKLNQEKDASQVQLSESRRELNELKSALRVAQMEKEQQRLARQDLMLYVRRLEERLDKLADEKWKEDKMLEEEPTGGLSQSSSPAALSDSEEESPEMQRLPNQLGACRISDQQCSSTQFPKELQKVVINQPAPIACQLQPLPEDSPDSW